MKHTGPFDPIPPSLVDVWHSGSPYPKPTRMSNIRMKIAMWLVEFAVEKIAVDAYSTEDAKSVLRSWKSRWTRE